MVLNDCDDLIAAILLGGWVLVRTQGNHRTCRRLNTSCWLFRGGIGGLRDEIRRHIESDGTIACTTVLKGCNLSCLFLLSFLVSARRSRLFPLLIRSLRRVNHDQISACSRRVTVVAGRVSAHITTAIFRGSGGLRCRRIHLGGAVLIGQAELPSFRGG